MAESIVEKVARAIYEADDVWSAAFPWPSMGSRDQSADNYRRIARAAIEATKLEQLLMAAYVRGVEWNEENPLDREYRFKAAGDYADKTISALNEEVAG